MFERHGVPTFDEHAVHQSHFGVTKRYELATRAVCRAYTAVNATAQDSLAQEMSGRLSVSRQTRVVEKYVRHD